MRVKRVTILTGHYGSGKTSLAVNWAIRLSRTGKPVAIADLDIVNPYFRTTDHRRELEESGVRLVGSPFAGSNLDIPALPRELYAAVEDRTVYAVLDVGGDDRGAVALGRYVPSVLAEDNYEMMFVTNFFRPLTKTPEEALTVLREVEAACGLACTGLVNNSNLGVQTTAQNVLDTAERMEKLSALSGLPVLMTSADSRLCPELEEKIFPLFPLDFSERKS